MYYNIHTMLFKFLSVGVSNKLPQRDSQKPKTQNRISLNEQLENQWEGNIYKHLCMSLVQLFHIQTT